DCVFKSCRGQGAAVGRELQGGDEPGRGDALEFLSAEFEVPDNDPVIEATPGRRLSVGRDVQGSHSTHSEITAPHFIRVHDIPDTGRVVQPGGNDPVTLV